MLRVLVTGGAGYIGSHLCKALAKDGCLPVTFDNLSTGHEEAVRWGPLIKGDLKDLDLLRKTLRDERIGAVFHLAARAQVGESMQAPISYLQTNVGGTLNLLEAMQREDVVDLIFASSCSVYWPIVKGPIREVYPTSPQNVYGHSKLMAEEAISWASERLENNLAAVRLRFFNVAGADPGGELGEWPTSTRLIPSAIQAALGLRPPLPIYGDGSQVRDYVHVHDVALACVEALAFLHTSDQSGLGNVGRGKGYTVAQVLHTVGEILGTPVPCTFELERPGDPTEPLVADITHTKGFLNWAPQWSLEEMINDANAWMTKAVLTEGSIR